MGRKRVFGNRKWMNQLPMAGSRKQRREHHHQGQSTKLKNDDLGVPIFGCEPDRAENRLRRWGRQTLTIQKEKRDKETLRKIFRRTEKKNHARAERFVTVQVQQKEEKEEAGIISPRGDHAGEEDARIVPVLAKNPTARRAR